MSEDQLREIREILMATVTLTQQCREDIAALTREVRNNTANMNRLSERVDQFVTQAEADRELINSTVRGMSLEVHRIIEHLFSEQGEQGNQ